MNRSEGETRTIRAIKVIFDEKAEEDSDADLAMFLEVAYPTMECQNG